MKCIKELVDHIYEEINDACEYASQAIEAKNKDRTLGDTYINIAKEEMNHMNRLHEQVTRLIAERKTKAEEIPTGMSEIYEWEHEKIIREAAKVQVIIGLYK